MKHLSRRSARRQAFLVLYQSDVTGWPVEGVLDRWRDSGRDLDEYAISLTREVERSREDLDARLSEVSEGWPVYRMSAVDRSIMRLALYEILHVEDVPQEAAINEAVELAKGYSSEESPSFVGGVLHAAGGRLVEHG